MRCVVAISVTGRPWRAPGGHRSGMPVCCTADEGHVRLRQSRDRVGDRRRHATEGMPVNQSSPYRASASMLLAEGSAFIVRSLALLGLRGRGPHRPRSGRTGAPRSAHDQGVWRGHARRRQACRHRSRAVCRRPRRAARPRHRPRRHAAATWPPSPRRPATGPE